MEAALRKFLDCLARAALRLYPRAWRERYGEEMLALVEEAPARPAVVLDLVRGAVRECGVPRAAAWAVRLIGRVVWAWLVAVASVAALWILFVVTFAPNGAAWMGFDQHDWVRQRLAETRRLVIPTASFSVVPSLIVGLPGIVLLFILRAGRRPWLARAAALSSFMIFSVWWDGTLFVQTHGHQSMRGWSPEFGHFAALIAGWLIAVWLFPRRRGTAGATPMEGMPVGAGHLRDSSPRAILRAHLVAS